MDKKFSLSPAAPAAATIVIQIGGGWQVSPELEGMQGECLCSSNASCGRELVQTTVAAEGVCGGG
jgi:hypothetical protein